MSRTHRSRVTQIAALASCVMLFLGGSALAQTVPVFDDAPSIEQLRSIMIPESRPSTTRAIVIQRTDADASPSVVERVATQESPPRMPPAPAKVSPPPIVHAAARMPAPPPDASAEAGTVAFHVNFAFNSAIIPDSAHEMIGLIAQLMKESPEIKVRVEGHTDAAGSPSYNMSLSERRALSVGEFLIKEGVDPSRLEVVGKGMSEPLTRNKYDPANRRVQFVRVG